MTIQGLNEFAATLLTISLATERLVAVMKSTFPWLADEKKKTDNSGEADLHRDKWRRVIVWLVAVGGAWVTTGFLAPKETFDLLGPMVLGSGPDAPALPVPIIALLASGGSAFWSGIVGYSGALRDEKRRTAEQRGLVNKVMGNAKGAVVVNTAAGMAAPAYSMMILEGQSGQTKRT